MDRNELIQDIKDFLMFRKKFTKRQWAELNQKIIFVENDKADKIVLYDSDIEKICKMIIKD